MHAEEMTEIKVREEWRKKRKRLKKVCEDTGEEIMN
jgi:hypothetical protein